MPREYNVPMEVRAFAESDLEGVVLLAAAEGWPSLSTDAARALRALTAPGVLTVVAISEGKVIGYAHALTDRVTTTYLSTIAVDTDHRGQHVGQALLEQVFQRSGIERMDLLSEDASEGFYQRLLHFRKPGYRLYRQPAPSAAPGDAS